jgi:hypothetical protein
MKERNDDVRLADVPTSVLEAEVRRRFASMRQTETPAGAELVDTPTTTLPCRPGASSPAAASSTRSCTTAQRRPRS